jgi:hypothetical protein
MMIAYSNGTGGSLACGLFAQRHVTKPLTNDGQKISTGT